MTGTGIGGIRGILTIAHPFVWRTLSSTGRTTPGKSDSDFPERGHASDELLEYTTVLPLPR
jgi:hypothetical protein